MNIKKFKIKKKKGNIFIKHFTIKITINRQNIFTESGIFISISDSHEKNVVLSIFAVINYMYLSC